METVDLLFLSPHCDDALISCGGRILQEMMEGSSILLLSFFTKGDESPESCSYYAARKEEDRCAASLLGAEVHHLDFPDAPYRNKNFRGFSGVIIGEEPNDSPLLEELQKKLVEICSELSPKIIFAPLGIGRHVDHRLLYQAAQVLLTKHKVLFYEDKPYAFAANAVLQRLIELNVALKGKPCREATKTTSKRLTHDYLETTKSVHYLKHGLRPGPERLRTLLYLARIFHKSPEAQRLTLEAEFSKISLEAFDMFAVAVSSYTTELPQLFGSKERFEHEAREYSRLLAGKAISYFERYWHHA